MKIVDKVVLAVFVVALVALCFFQKCTLDIYALVLGFAVAVIAGIAMLRRDLKDRDVKKTQ